MIAQNILSANSLAKRLSILCFIGAFGWAVTTCGGDSSGECASDEEKVTIDGKKACYQTCESATDCDGSNEQCRQGFCVAIGGGNGGDMDAGIDDDGTGGGGDGGNGAGDGGGSGDGGFVGGGETGMCSNENRGDQNCRYMRNCIGQCGQDPQCQQECDGNVKCEGLENFQGYQECLRGNCTGGNAGPNCGLDNCKSQMNQCGLLGDRSCDKSYICFQACASANLDEQQNLDPQGFSKCLADNCPPASEEAQRQRTALASCRGSQCGSGSAPGCAWENCASNYQTCGLTGNGTCKDLQTCLTQARAQAQQGLHQAYLTLFQCIFSAPKEEQLKDAEITKCANSNCDISGVCKQDPTTTCSQNGDCPNGDCNTKQDPTAEATTRCEVENCDSQRSTCGVVKTESNAGNKTCADIVQCQSNCGQNSTATCSEECRFDAPKSAQLDLADMNVCIANECPAGDFMNQQAYTTCINNAVAGSCNNSNNPCDEDSDCPNGACTFGPCTEEANTCGAIDIPAATGGGDAGMSDAGSTSGSDAGMSDAGSTSGSDAGLSDAGSTSGSGDVGADAGLDDGGTGSTG